MTDVEALDELNKVCTSGVGCSAVRCRTMAALKIALRALSEKVEREAADMMEREKEYEYTVIAKKHDGGVFIDTEHFSTLESAKKNAENGFYDVIRYERREVGEWEEVFA